MRAFDSDTISVYAFKAYRREEEEEIVPREAAKDNNRITFMAISKSDGKTVLGFYSLGPASLEYSRAAELIRKALARHDLPVFRLARLAVGRALQGQGLGGRLLLSAGRRCLLAATEVGGVALLIDAKNERAASWYASYGAVPLADAPRSLLLPLATVQAAN